MIGRVIRWGGLDWVGFREVDRGAFFLSVAALFPAPFDAGRGVGFFGSSLFRQLHEDFLPGLKRRAASEDGSGFRVREFLMTDGQGGRGGEPGPARLSAGPALGRGFEGGARGVRRARI